MVIKRDGRLKEFEKQKVWFAVKRAALSVEEYQDPERRQEVEDLATNITEKIYAYYEKLNRDMSVEEIQDMIENKLMCSSHKKIAQAYIRYRQKRTDRRGNITDKTMLEIIDGTNAYWNDENSNKNASLISTQRDYMAGATSTDLTRRMILPEEVTAAHDAGIIHVHDCDYFIMHLFNCCLVNVQDMLLNGTVINKVKIDPPNSFSVACTVMSQIAGVVASGQLGGQTMSLSALVPFVKKSREKHRAQVAKIFSYDRPEWFNIDIINKIAEDDLKKEIKDGIQTLAYQINTINSTNGQTPFITIFGYLNEVAEEDKDDLAMIIAEVFNQRRQGFKNENGHWVTPAFPKLIYVLEEDNITEESKYWWLTELAAKTTSERLVPDYISEKMMLELKGDCFPCMGCRSFLNHNDEHKYYGRLTLC